LLHSIITLQDDSIYLRSIISSRPPDAAVAVAADDDARSHTDAGVDCISGDVGDYAAAVSKPTPAHLSDQWWRA